MADETQIAAFVLNENGNIDRVRTTDGSIPHRVNACRGGGGRGKDSSRQLQDHDGKR